MPSAAARHCTEHKTHSGPDSRPHSNHDTEIKSSKIQMLKTLCNLQRGRESEGEWWRERKEKGKCTGTMWTLAMSRKSRFFLGGGDLTLKKIHWIESYCSNWHVSSSSLLHFCLILFHFCFFFLICQIYLSTVKKITKNLFRIHKNFPFSTCMSVYDEVKVRSEEKKKAPWRPNFPFPVQTNVGIRVTTANS